MATRGSPSPTARPNRRFGTCGLCGRTGQLTKTHVPARCAGNRGRVRRFSIMSDSDHVARNSRKDIGGLHFYGLCGSCNGVIQNRWESAYCSFARQLWPLATDARVHLPRRITMPDVDVAPGAIARSVLVGCFALESNLRDLYPDVARALIDDADAIELPAPMDLYLAITRGPSARVTGSIAGFHLFGPEVDGRKVGIMTMAQIYFPPLAWQLADTPTSARLRIEGWHCVTEWLNLPPRKSFPLRQFIADLPLVMDPRQTARGLSDWFEFHGEETTFVVEGESALRSSWE